MIIKKDVLPSLPTGIRWYVEEYFTSGLIFGEEEYHAFIGPDFPVTKNIVLGRAPIHSDAADNLFSEGLVGKKLTEWILDQQENPHAGVALFKF